MFEPPDIPGAADVIAWFGYWPRFHDAEVLSITLDASAGARVVIRAFEMTTEVDASGHYVLAKHCVVTFLLEGFPTDPYGTTNQFGFVQFWYYGSLANGGAAPGTQCTNTASPGTCPGTTPVNAGQVLTYTLYNGSAQWGLDNRGAGFTGYLIAQAQFQYCHAFAFISALGAGPTAPGISEGYLALVLDTPSFVRGAPQGESLGQ